MMKGVNLRFSATNAASPVMRKVQRDLSGVQNTVRKGGPLMRSWNAGLNSNRRAVQQLGFQMSDFAIQISGGQSAMLAFTQQGGQMLQFFGPAGAILAAFLAIFGSLAIAFTKSGHAMSELFPLMGVLQDEFRGLGRTVDAAKEALIDFANLTINNLDTVLIAAALTAGFFAGRWIVSIVMASSAVAGLRSVLLATALSFQLAGGRAALMTVATSAMTGAFNLLRVALMRLGIPALIIAMSYLIERFLHLRRVVGGTGEAFSILKDIAVAFFKAIPDLAKAGWYKMAAYFYEALADMVTGFTNFGQDIADGLNSLFGSNLKFTMGQGASDSLYEMARSMQTTAGAALSSSEAVADLSSKVAALKALMKEDKIDIRDWFGGGGGDKDGKGGKDALSEIQKRVQSLADTMKSAMSEAFTSMVDGTKSVTDAFRDMAASIIKKLFDILVVQQLVGSFDVKTGAGSGIVGAVMGGLSGSGLFGGSFEGGGFTWKGPRSGGLDGKGGRLAMLHPNESVTDHVKGGGSGGVSINYTFQGGVTEADLGRAIPLLVERTKREVVDAVQRGGSVAKVFG